MSRNLALLATTLCTLAACNALFGVDDYEVAEPATGGGSVGGAGGAGGGSTECLANEVRPCYDGPEGTENVGVCLAGTQICLEDGSGFDACEAQVQPGIDDCGSEEDEDCNGLTCGEPIWTLVISDNSPNIADQKVRGVASDDDQVVVVGVYREALRVGGTLLPGGGTQDAYVAKLDAQGNLLWLEGIVGAGQQDANAVAIDESGNIYVAGEFQTELVYGDDTFVNAVSRDAFVMKLDTEGGLLWLKQFGNDAPVGALDIAATTDLVALVGDFSGAVDLGLESFDAGMRSEGYTLVLDGSGAVRWAKHLASTAGSTVNGVAIAGNRVVIGAAFDIGVLVDGTTVDGTGTDGLLVAYQGPNGNYIEHVHLTGDGNDEVVDLAALGNDVIVGGTFESDLDCGDGMVHSANVRDMFVARYAATLGPPAWSKTIGGSDIERLIDLAVDATGEICLTGTFSTDIEWQGTPVPVAGSQDVFVAKLDATGAPRFLATYGDGDTDSGTAISVRPTSRELFVAGDFAGQMVVGTASYSAQAIDGFLMRLGP